jgi:carbamoyltransferase
MSRLILGINSAHADSSAVLVGDQGIVAAITEERLNRRKHCAGFPALATREVLRIAGAVPRDITDIAVAREPRANLGAKAAFVARDPFRRVTQAAERLRIHRGVASTAGLVAEALGVPSSDVQAKFHQVEHHLAHIASSFFCSPFERATGVSADGAGDFASAMVARCEGTQIAVEQRTLWPHSPGVFYTALCQLIGFDKFGEEYKVMGLSAYGANRFVRHMREIASYEPERGFRLDLRYFKHHKQPRGLEVVDNGDVSVPPLWSEELEKLLGPPRKRPAPVGDRECDIAASMQTHFEDMYLAYVQDATRTVGLRDVVMAGGCVLNSVANGRMITEGVVDRAYFHPAASDDGTAAGAALYVLHSKPRARRAPPMRHGYLGAEWTDGAIERALEASKLPFKKVDRPTLVATAADALANGKIVGWFQGREEWGPRALGNRSILCHPGWPDMKATLNARIKNREPFRPFAPAVLAEKLDVCFRGTHEVPFMIVVYKVRPEWKQRLSAVTHEDGTGRVQTVRRDENELYYDVIAAFEQKTGTPVVLNTSFNENEPIVHTPEQAIDCFARTKMDSLGIGSFWLDKPSATFIVPLHMEGARDEG